MNKKEELTQKIKELESQLAPLKEELRDIWHAEEQAIQVRIYEAYKMKSAFSDDELLYSATARCNCGAGMAYPHGTGIRGAWHCSDVLTGRAKDVTVEHSQLSFMMYEIKSEDQPSANGATTRPKPQN